MIIYSLIAVIQMILHYLGWAGIVLGVISLIFGNMNRGKELAIGGISFIVLKYIIGFIYFSVVSIYKLITDKK